MTPANAARARVTLRILTANIVAHSIPDHASNTWRQPMATYSCDKCDMYVNATCGHCDAPLENDNLSLPDGLVVQISKCPNGHGKIKSPLCCGEDMSCAA